ncbi:hypothetical protein ACFE04_031667 [Oxalis oulophora]
MVSSWFCFSNPDSRHVKIIDPGGHEEVFDRPVLAAEINLGTPDQPWAIVTPETMLMPGQRFYVVSTGTLRRLQKISMKHSMSMSISTAPSHPVKSSGNSTDKVKNDDSPTPTCWSPCGSKDASSSDSKKTEHRNLNDGRSSNGDNYQNCLSCLPTGMEIKGNRTIDSVDDSSSSNSLDLQPPPVNPKRHRRIKSTGSMEFPRKSIDQHWEPSQVVEGSGRVLESVGSPQSKKKMAAENAAEGADVVTICETLKSVNSFHNPSSYVF